MRKKYCCSPVIYYPGDKFIWVSVWEVLPDNRFWFIKFAIVGVRT
jgi:hypothetical protein